MSGDEQIPKQLSIQEVAEILGVPVKTLYAWKTTGYGPRAYKCGRHVRYTPADVRAWIDAQRAAVTS